jgi:CRP/FNR family transcriptional regulator
VRGSRWRGRPPPDGRRPDLPARAVRTGFEPPFGLLATLERAIRLPLEARLIHLLLDLADEAGIVAMSQERLAAHLGTSREVVSRIVRTLAAAALLEVAYGKVRLLDSEALARRSDNDAGH